MSYCKLPRHLLKHAIHGLIIDMQTIILHVSRVETRADLRALCEDYILLYAVANAPDLPEDNEMTDEKLVSLIRKGLNLKSDTETVRHALSETWRGILCDRMSMMEGLLDTVEEMPGD